MKLTESEQKEYEHFMELSIDELEKKYRAFAFSEDLNYTGNSYSDGKLNKMNRNSDRRMAEIIREVLSIKQAEKHEYEREVQERRIEARDQETLSMFKQIKEQYKREHPIKYLSLKLFGSERARRQYTDYEQQVYNSNNIQLEFPESENRGYGR